MTATATQVRKGDTFRVPFQDGTILYEVTRIVGARVYAVVVDEPIEIPGFGDGVIHTDGAGQEHSFLREEAANKIAHDRTMQSFFDRAKHDEAAFWASCKVGDTIHYNNFGSSWVRGVVTEEGGEKVMQPTSLVGEWRDYDLPRRNADGTVYYPLLARKVHEGESLRPRASCIYESETCTYAGGDPTILPEVSLDLPEPTAEEEAQFAAERMLVQVRQIADDVTSASTERLRQVRDLLG